ncbi:MAG: flagellar basal body rod C-terminal domain-containing protein [Nakamurella sp.]
MYDAINTSATGLTTYRAWIDVIADNIANVNTVKPMNQTAFQASYAEAREIGAGPDGVGRGVNIVALGKGDPQGDVTFSPSDPNANQEGYVRRPDINLAQQMGDLILAQRAFQANANAVDRSKAMYQAAIQIGKGM